MKMKTNFEHKACARVQSIGRYACGILRES